jgi:PAS domain-containing protein
MYVILCISRAQAEDTLLQRHIKLGHDWNLGLYTWDLSSNRLIADEVYAHIYGFDPLQLVQGLSIEEVLMRVYDQDREQAARDTHAAITTGRLTSTVFRVRHRGVLRNVLSFGRCFMDTDGTPHIFTGGIQYQDDAAEALERIDFVQSRH